MNQTEEKPQSQKDEARQDCLSCKLIGSGTMLGVSAYTLLQYHGMPKHQVGSRVFAGGLSILFAGLGVARWTVDSW